MLAEKWGDWLRLQVWPDAERERERDEGVEEEGIVSMEGRKSAR